MAPNQVLYHAHTDITGSLNDVNQAVLYFLKLIQYNISFTANTPLER